MKRNVVITIIIAVVITIPIVISNSVYDDRYSSITDSNNITSLYSIGSQSVEELTKHTQSAIDILELIASTDSVNNLITEYDDKSYIEVNKMISFAKKSYIDIIDEVYILDSTSEVILSNTITDMDLKGNNIVQTALGGSLNYSVYIDVLGEIRGELAIPIYDEKAIIGALFFSSNMSVFEDYVIEVRNSNTKIDCYIVNSNGTFLTTSRNNIYSKNKEKINIDKIFSEIDYNNNSSYVSYSGEEVYGAYFPIYGNNYMILELPKSNSDLAIKLSEITAFVEILIVLIIKKYTEIKAKEADDD